MASDEGRRGPESQRYPPDQATPLTRHAFSCTSADAKSAIPHPIAQGKSSGTTRTSSEWSNLDVGVSRIPRAPLRAHTCQHPPVLNPASTRPTDLAGVRQVGKAEVSDSTRPTALTGVQEAEVSHAHHSPPCQNPSQFAKTPAEELPPGSKSCSTQMWRRPSDAMLENVHNILQAPADSCCSTDVRSVPTERPPLAAENSASTATEATATIRQRKVGPSSETPQSKGPSLPARATNPKAPLQIRGGVLPLAKRPRRYPCQNRPPRTNAQGPSQKLGSPHESPGASRMQAPCDGNPPYASAGSGSLAMDPPGVPAHTENCRPPFTGPPGVPGHTENCRPPQNDARPRPAASPLQVILAAPSPLASTRQRLQGHGGTDYSSDVTHLAIFDSQGRVLSPSPCMLRSGSPPQAAVGKVQTLQRPLGTYTAKSPAEIAETLQSPLGVYVMKSPAEVADAVFAEAERRAALARRRKRRVEQIVALQWRTFVAARKAEQREALQVAEACRHRNCVLLRAGWTAFCTNTIHVRPAPFLAQILTSSSNMQFILNVQKILNFSNKIKFVSGLQFEALEPQTVFPIFLFYMFLKM